MSFPTLDAGSPAVDANDARGWKSIAPAVVGNVFEWYDFTVYAFVAPYVARAFFPASDPVTGLLGAFAAFGIGFVARPLGGIVLGRMGDLRGRKAALLLTIHCMAAGTLLVGVLPAYASIGVLAPVLLVGARLLQGFSAGGEFGSAIAFIVEWAPENRRGFLGSFHVVGIVGGILLGSGVAAALASAFTPAEMAAWAWRLPFLVGSLLGPVGLYMRRHVDETPSFRAVAAEHRAPPPMLRDRDGFLLSVKACGMSVLSNMAFYVLLFYMPTWLQTYARLSPSAALWTNTAGLLALVLCIPVFGLLSDRFGRKPILLLGCIGSILLPVPCFSLLSGAPGTGAAQVVAVQVAFAVLLATFSGALSTALVEMFATRNRSTWMGTGYAVSVAVFGGFAPFASVWLIAWSGNPAAPAYYLIAGALLSGVATLLARETAFEPLR